MGRSSSISGFYKLPPKERLAMVKEFANLSDEECAVLQNTGALPLDAADRMIENVVGAFPLPLGIGVNLNNEPARSEPAAVSIKELTGKHASPKILLDCFLDEFEGEDWDHVYDNSGADAYLPRYDVPPDD